MVLEQALPSICWCGQWLMESLDTTIDPIHTIVRDFLRDEGTIQVLPLPEIPDACVDMMPLHLHAG